MSSSSRQYEFVLWGATGYTGLYAAEHIVTAFPTDLQWAIAGRSREKLEAIAKKIKSLNPDRKEPAIEVAQLTASDLDALSKKTRLIMNTVGPYCKYGEPVVKACAANGTHYVDVTGEGPWVRDMVERYHDKAKASGAIIIPEIGLESVPPDMITYAATKYVREVLGAATREVVLTAYKMKMAPSGGTLATVFAIFDTYSLAYLAGSGSPGITSPISLPKHAPRPLAERLTGVRSDTSDLGTMTTSISGVSDAPIVYRSWGLLTQQGESYGPNFRFSPHMTVRNTMRGVLVHLALLFGPLMLALPPVRWLLAKLVYQPGQGPTREEVRHDSAEWRAVAFPDAQTDQKALAVCKWRGSAYHLTGITISEGARSILYDDTVAKRIGGGVLTSATLGQPYLDRLANAGLEVELKTLRG